MTVQFINLSNISFMHFALLCASNMKFDAFAKGTKRLIDDVFDGNEIKIEPKNHDEQSTIIPEVPVI